MHIYNSELFKYNFAWAYIYNLFCQKILTLNKMIKTCRTTMKVSFCNLVGWYDKMCCCKNVQLNCMYFCGLTVIMLPYWATSSSMQVFYVSTLLIINATTTRLLNRPLLSLQGCFLFKVYVVRFLCSFSLTNHSLQILRQSISWIVPGLTLT